MNTTTRIATRAAWALWAVLPVFGLAYHFGPGQDQLERDAGARALRDAVEAEQLAEQQQAKAHAAQLERIAAEKELFLVEAGAGQTSFEQQALKEFEDEVELKRTAEAAAYEVAASQWKLAADKFQIVEDRIGDTREGLEVRWAKARALVRAGEVWNGIDELQSIVEVAESDERPAPELAVAAREELAVANYYGARLLREEGRPTEEWRRASGLARQQYRYLAERAARDGAADLADSLQRNLERVLDLEQLDTGDLHGVPLPREAPRARSGRDRGPPRPGQRGPTRRGPPGNGAGAPLEIGPGW
jgi:hypothetical protein